MKQHVQRMDASRMPMQIINYKLIGRCQHVDRRDGWRTNEVGTGISLKVSLQML